jgi:transposase-like protein
LRRTKTRSALWIEVIQRTVYRQVGEHDHLLDAQQQEKRDQEKKTDLFS